MGASDAVHLNNPGGGMTQIGKAGYGGESETGLSSIKTARAKAEGLAGTFTGMAGSTAARTSAAVLMNSSHLAKHLADQAVRSVLGEKAVLQGDENADYEQKGSLSANESHTGVVAKAINV